MKKNIISARELTKVYYRGSEEILALNKVSLTIQEGEFLAIIGPSGSGKTTLLNLIGCLDTATEGTLKINGTDACSMKEAQLVKLRRENIGFVFQQFFLLPTLTVRENMELPLLFSKRDHRNGIDGILTQVGLGERAEHLPCQLSGGEMQRVAIGRALMNHPKIILADEPTGNLDSATAEKILELFRNLKSKGLTIIIVTHNLDLARKADRIIALRDGKIVMPD